MIRSRHLRYLRGAAAVFQSLFGCPVVLTIKESQSKQQRTEGERLQKKPFHF
jgi:hypothetical protein